MAERRTKSRMICTCHFGGHEATNCGVGSGRSREKRMSDGDGSGHHGGVPVTISAKTGAGHWSGSVHWRHYGVYCHCACGRMSGDLTMASGCGIERDCGWECVNRIWIERNVFSTSKTTPLDVYVWSVSWNGFEIGSSSVHDSWTRTETMWLMVDRLLSGGDLAGSRRLWASSSRRPILAGIGDLNRPPHCSSSFRNNCCSHRRTLRHRGSSRGTRRRTCWPAVDCDSI